MSDVPMRVAVFGAGYVGLVTGACFADLGHEVVVRDVVPERIEALRRGQVPIYEPGLRELLDRAGARLRFTIDVGEAIEGADVVYIAVGTPPTYSGDADLSAVWTVVDELPQIDRRIVVVTKSTVPVGTGEKIRHRLDARGLPHVGYASNPEFTAEGTAVRDFMHPDRIVIGAFRDEDADVVEVLHAGIDAPVVRCDVASAEMIKLAANAALMTRISFINEIANVCEATGADVVKVAEGIGLDRRIGKSFLRAGIGFGGSCLTGEESVLVRRGRRATLVSLERLYGEAAPGEEIEILTWRPDGDGPEFQQLACLTRRPYDSEILEIRMKMGRRVRATPDHEFITREGRKLGSELGTNDWLPVAQGPVRETYPPPRWLNVLEGMASSDIRPDQLIVRPNRDELAISARELQTAIHGLGHPRGGVPAYDILRSAAMRLPEAAVLDVDLADASFGTETNGTHVNGVMAADEPFWRVVGLYLAEGHCSRDGLRQRLYWSFHPSREEHLLQEVSRFWSDRGVHCAVRRGMTSADVVVSSRLLATWWTDVLGLGRTCYEQRLPDAIWSEPESCRRALLAGLWEGDGSWSLVRGGPSVVLELGTVSRELADGVLRLLGDLGVMARLEVGRTAKSTVETYWLVISGADQIERVIDLVPAAQRGTVLESLARQRKRTLPTGYRREYNAAWARIVSVERRPHRGFVYSLEVPPNHTFVTTGGLVVSNCFPKDSLALKQLAANSGYHFQLLNAVIEVNELQKRRVIAKLQRHLGTLRGRTVALLGLAFKPDTDDMREAPSLVLAGRLLAEGADVRAWDPVARPDGLHGVTQVETVAEAVAGADAAVLVTEWPELVDLDWAALAKTMERPVLVDGRNLLDPVAMRAAGYRYDAVGRAARPPEREG